MSENPLTELLRPHVAAIKASANCGDIRAMEIIRLYGLHQACPNDPGAPALCRAAFDEWMRDRP